MAHNGSKNKNSSLKIRQQETLPILASAASITEAARLSNVSRRTLTRWLKDEDFRKQLSQIHEESAELARVKLQGLMLQAASVLEDTLHDPNPALRFRAAQSAIRFSTELNTSGNSGTRSRIWKRPCPCGR